jgi:hypothetical protein
MKPYILERRMKTSTVNKLVLLISLLPSLCLASGAPELQVLKDHTGLFQWVLGGALCLNGYFIVRTLNSIDRQWKSIGLIDKRLSHLEGEHTAHMRDGGKCE